MVERVTMDRRHVVGAIAGLSTGASMIARSGPAPGSRIDVHMHYVPRFYRDALIAAGQSRPDGIPALPEWSLEAALAAMDQVGIAAALMSISSPGVHLGDAAAARRLARRVNEEGARARAAYPARFGFFASLPLPDIDAALAETTHALDVLGAEGVVLLTNHRGLYPGAPALDPLYAELNRRKAVVFLHPTSPACPCCNGPHATTPDASLPPPLLEFIFETTRAVIGLVLAGTLRRFPDIRIIVPHAGAALPVVADRVAGLIPALKLAGAPDARQIFEQLRRFHYDLAGFPIPRLLSALQQIADPDRLLYGSDWPYTPLPAVLRLAGQQATTPLLTPELRDRMLYGNALRLFPRLAATSGG